MSKLDLFILLPIAWGAYKGYRRGLLIEAVSIFALVLAIIVSFKFLGEATHFLSKYIDNSFTQRLLPFLGFAVLFIPIVFFINKIGYLIRGATKATLLGSVDTFAGAIVGASMWAVGVSTLLWIVTSIGIKIENNPDQKSYLYDIVAPITPKVVDKTTDFINKTDFKAIKEKL